MKCLPLSLVSVLSIGVGGFFLRQVTFSKDVVIRYVARISQYDEWDISQVPYFLFRINEFRMTIFIKCNISFLYHLTDLSVSYVESIWLEWSMLFIFLLQSSILSRPVLLLLDVLMYCRKHCHRTLVTPLEA